MNVLVFGGAGYIGSHTVLDLIKHGHRVTVYDNLSTGSEANLFPETHFVKGDILDTENLDRIFKIGAFDAVFHFAALKAAGDSMNQPERYTRHNLEASFNIINKAVGAGVKYFIFSSSAAVYGSPEYCPIDEQHPLNPENFYGYTKLQIERHLQWFSKLKGMRFAALRYFNAAGYDADMRVKDIEHKTQNLIPVMMEFALGLRDQLYIFGDDYDTPDGTCIRDYIHVSDLTLAHTQALDYLAEHNQDLIVNLGTGRGASVKEVVATTEKVIGKKIPYIMSDRREGDPASLFASSKKASELLGWEPRHSSLENMITTTWNIYRHHIETQAATPETN